MDSLYIFFKLKLSAWEYAVVGCFSLSSSYFYIQHRGERRGLGGIFFDDLNDYDPLLLVITCIYKSDGSNWKDI